MQHNVHAAGMPGAPPGACRAHGSPGAFRPGAVMNERIRAGARLLASAVALLLPFATPAAAQRADFLFRRPLVTAALRGGWAVPRAQSEIFDFTTNRLTVKRADFAGGAVDFEGAVRVKDRVDVSLGVGYSAAKVRSEFRNFVEDNDLPIEQTT